MSGNTKILFIHIPKTGGVSIEQALGRLTNVEPCPIYISEEFFELKEPEHYNFFHGHLEYFLHDFIKPDFTFTILRNPIERAVSAFEHIARDNHHIAHPLYLEAPDIIRALSHNKLKQHFSNAMTLFLGLRPELRKFRTARQALNHARNNYSAENLLSNAKKALEEMDFIGFTESLESNQEYLHTRLSPDSATDFKAINTNHNPLKSAATYQENLPSDAIHRLREANTLDIELYTFAQALAKQKGWILDGHSHKEKDQKRIRLEIAKNAYFETMERKPELQGLDYNFSQPLDGYGWYPRETDGQKYWRFTGPDERALLYFPKLSLSTGTLTLDVLHAITPEHFSSFQVRLNGFLLTERTYRDMTVIFSIPTEALASHTYTCIEILTLPPQKPDGEDSRKLGIAFCACKIKG